jgi:hypothetical protein
MLPQLDLIGYAYALVDRLNSPERARTWWSKTALSNGFVRNSTAPALNASIRIFVPPYVVMKIVGRSRRNASTKSLNRLPVYRRNEIPDSDPSST